MKTTDISKRNARDAAQWSFARHDLQAEKDRDALLHKVLTVQLIIDSERNEYAPDPPPSSSILNEIEDEIR